MIWNSKIFLPALMMFRTAARAWNFVVYSDSVCETSPSANYSGDGNQGCTDNPTAHRGFEIYDMKNCLIQLYATQEDCDTLNWQQEYGAGNEETCIPPDFVWDYYEISDC